jgi:hypothetical protein
MTRRQRVWTILVFILVLLGGLLVNMPVVHLMRWVQLPAGVQIQGLAGTPATFSLDRVRYQNFELQDLVLEFQAACLLRLQVCYQAVSSTSGLSATLRGHVLDQTLQLSDARLQLPKEILRQFPQLLVQPSGEFNLNVRSLVFADPQIIELDAMLNWADAGIQGEQQVLGNYTARFALTAEGLAIELDDQDSLLSMKGNALISRDGLYRFQIRLTGKPGLNRSVYSVLDMAGQKTAANNYLVNQSGRLQPQFASQLGRLLAVP